MRFSILSSNRVRDSLAKKAAVFVALCSIAVFAGITQAEPVDLSPPKNSMGYADENGYFQIIQRFGDVEFSNGFSIPLRFDFWSGREPRDRRSPYGWHGWRCGAIESRVTAYGGERFLKVELLCAKTLFLEKVNDSENQYLSPDRSWVGVGDKNELTLSRADGWELIFKNGIIMEMTTDDGLVIEWMRDDEGRLQRIRESGSDAPNLVLNWTEDEDAPPAVSQLSAGGSTSEFEFSFQRPVHLNYSMNVDWKPEKKERIEVAFRHQGNELEVESGEGMIRRYEWDTTSGWLTSDGVNRYDIQKSDDELITVRMESATGKKTSRVVKNDEVILESAEGIKWRTRYSTEPGITYRSITGIDREEDGSWLPVLENEFDSTGLLTGRRLYADHQRYRHYSDGKVERVLFPEPGLEPSALFYLKVFTTTPVEISYQYDESKHHLSTKVNGKTAYERRYNENGDITLARIPGRYTRTAEFDDDGTYRITLEIDGLTRDNWPKFYKEDDSLTPELQISAAFRNDDTLLSETLLDGTTNRYEYGGEDNLQLVSKTHLAADGETVISKLSYTPTQDRKVVITDENFLLKKTRYFLVMLDEAGEIIESTSLSDHRAQSLLKDI